MPPTIEPRMFVLTVALLPLYLFVAAKVCDRFTKKGGPHTTHKREAWALIVIGLAYIVLMIGQLRFMRWDDKAFVSLFSWACAHGMPAILIGRMTWTVVLVLKTTGKNEPARQP